MNFFGRQQQPPQQQMIAPYQYPQQAPAQQMDSTVPAYTKATTFGIPMETYKQGFLNVIARWNASSQSSNLAKGLYSRFRGQQQNGQPDDMSNIREQRIRAALQSVLSMPEGSLGNFSGAQAFGSAAVNYGAPQSAVSKMGTVRKSFFGMGGRATRKNRKQRKQRNGRSQKKH
jgi:hypothetical protein